jgi:hypothetical protein
MSHTDPAQHLVDLLVFAPIGLATQARDKVPELASAGRNQVALYQMVGKFAVAHGKNLVSKWADQQRAHAKARATRPSTEQATPSATTTTPVDPSGTAPTRSTPVSSATKRPAKKAASSSRRSPAANQPVTANDLAIADYDLLAASQIVGLLASLTSAQRTAIEDYESTHRRRSTVLGKLDRLRITP